MKINAEDNIPTVLQNTSKIVLNGRGKQCVYLLCNKLDLPQFYFRRYTKSIFSVLYNQAVPTDLNMLSVCLSVCYIYFLTGILNCTVSSMRAIPVCLFLKKS